MHINPRLARMTAKEHHPFDSHALATCWKVINTSTCLFSKMLPYLTIAPLLTYPKHNSTDNLMDTLVQFVQHYAAENTTQR